MEQRAYDVLIIGAGASGLMAAWELVQAGRKVMVIEARDRIGGRCFTIKDDRFTLPVELGAEFVHGKMELTSKLLKKGNIGFYEVEGDIWQNEDGKLEEQSDFIEDYSALNKKFKELKQDISVDRFINDYLQEDGLEELRFTLKNYVEGYYAADTLKASTFALRDELNKSEDKQSRIEGGYGKLLDFLFDECTNKGVEFRLSMPVHQVEWSSTKITVKANDQQFNSEKLLVTVPIGVLQAEKIRFSPALPEKMAAARKLGFGPVIKTILQFTDAFWKNKEYTDGKDLSKLSFVFSGATIPTWWTYHPKNAAMITGWSGGPHADKLKGLDEKEILETAIESLSQIFKITSDELNKKLKGWQVHNWLNDPYTCGGYSYEVVGGHEAIDIVKEPVDNRMFFAGEGLFKGLEIGTVNAALSIGQEVAWQIIASFKK